MSNRGKLGDNFADLSWLMSYGRVRNGMRVKDCMNAVLKGMMDKNVLTEGRFSTCKMTGNVFVVTGLIARALLVQSLSRPSLVCFCRVATSPLLEATHTASFSSA